MKGKFQRSYTSNKSGKAVKVFVYSLLGTEEELNAYQEHQGDNYRDNPETGEALFFTTRYAGQTVDIVQSQKTGNYFTDMSRFDQAASLAAQYGGNLGQELARQAALDLMGTGFRGNSPVSAPTQEKVETKDSSELS